MRGCFYQNAPTTYQNKVFPAYAGMFLGLALPLFLYKGFPRVCGDVSVAVLDKRLREAFSPRMRGCFSDASAKKDQSKVFPAYAGMFLVVTLTTTD